MSALNNDVAAVAFFSLFLWGSVRLLVRGFSFLDVIWVLAFAALCFFTKNTVWVAVPLAFLVIPLALLRGKARWFVWGGIVLGGIAAIFLAFSWTDAALWYRTSQQESPSRTTLEQAPHGAAVFHLRYDAVVKAGHTPLFQQVVPLDQSQGAAGKTITVGAWMWASQPIETLAPVLFLDGERNSYRQAFQVGTEPAFYAFTAPVSARPGRLVLQLYPLINNIEQPVDIYLDGIVLAVGEFPLQAAPRLDSGAAAGEWGGVPFSNLARNASAEAAWPRLHPLVDRAGVRFLPDKNWPSMILATLIDWRASDWYYQGVAAHLVRTFWGKFAWAQVSLLGHKPYRVPLVFTLIGLLGAVVGFWKCRRSEYWRGRLSAHTVLFLLAALAGIWIPTLLRGSGYFIIKPWFPTARYAYPAIIPTMLVLAAGWWAVWPGRFKQPGRVIIPVALGVFCLFAIYSVWHFYNG